MKSAQSAYLEEALYVFLFPHNCTMRAVCMQHLRQLLVKSYSNALNQSLDFFLKHQNTCNIKEIIAS